MPTFKRLPADVFWGALGVGEGGRVGFSSSCLGPKSLLHDIVSLGHGPRPSFISCHFLGCDSPSEARKVVQVQRAQEG